MSGVPAPGWYPDPTPLPGAPRGVRWWDGRAWSAYVEPGAHHGGVPRTPDGEPLADWWRRLVAYLVDGLIVAVPFAVLGVAWVVLALGAAMSDGTRSNGVNGPWFKIAFGVLLVVAVLYEALFLRFQGATPGKMLLGIRVRLHDRPGRLPWGAIALRMLVKGGGPTLASAVPLLWPVVGAGSLRYLFLLLDGLWPLWDAQRQALHDKAARTVVVRVR